MMFFQKWVDPREYTIGMSYILDDVVRDKKKYWELCAMMTPDGQPVADPGYKAMIRGVVSLMKTTDRHADKFTEKMQEASTPSEFFDLCDIVLRDYSRMVEIGKYVYYADAPGNVSLARFNDRLQVEVRKMIDRAYKSGVPFDDFKPYAERMEPKTLEKLVKKYKKTEDELHG